MNSVVNDAQRPWTNRNLSVEDRVTALIEVMNLEEKVAQLCAVWIGAESYDDDVAPHQNDLSNTIDLDALLPQGLGQITRPFGSSPVEPAQQAQWLAQLQQRVADSNRFGIPAIVHEECLAGFSAWKATAYPVPLSWGASFNPALIQEMASRIGNDLGRVGVHQGLAPVLDVTRDYRWGRVEETIGEDPYLVGSIGSAYVRGLEKAGIVATLKHFAGHSASRAGRNLAPVSMGPRERADVMLLPFEMAIRESGVRSVMHAYADTDGVPSAADRALLTDLLRSTWGFTGTVVADYFGIAFLHTLHSVAGSWGEAAAQALWAGVDIELPTVKTFGEPLLRELHEGRLGVEVIDTALRRVLRQKAELGLLDADWNPVPAALTSPHTPIDLDSDDNRALARRIANESVVLVRNEGTLPLHAPKTIAVIGPNANNPHAFLGCYSFPRHVGVQHPDVPEGIDLPTVLDAIRAEYPDTRVEWAGGCGVDEPSTEGIAAAVKLAQRADSVVLVLGDRAGLFGRGTSGEGCDVASLNLPGVQQQLVDAILDTGTPTIVTMISGRPYALGRAARESAAVLQTFFPGEEGAKAIAQVISGRVNPSGHLPVGIPADAGAQPATYLAAPLGQASEVSNLDPTAEYPFGHGLSYTAFSWSDPVVESTQAPTDGAFQFTLEVENIGDRHGTEVAQFYVHDPVASVVRPVQYLVGYTKVPLGPGERARVAVEVPADLTSFTGIDGKRIVEPGAVEIRGGSSSTDIRFALSLALTGPVRVVDHLRKFHPVITVNTPTDWH